MTCDATWPKFKGDLKSGAETILRSFNIDPEEYRLGKTKVFIRNPKTVCRLCSLLIP